MKFAKSLLMVGLLAVCTASFAQNGFNFYEVPRTVCLAQPQVISAASTNNFVDLRMFTGVAKIDVAACTNVASTSTLAILVSSDGTTWSGLTNYAVAVPTTINYTNSSTVGTNIYMLPGSLVTPTASTSGFATPYIQAPSYSSSGVITITNQPISIGFNVESAPRYMRLGWTASASTTIGAYLTARPGPWTP